MVRISLDPPPSASPAASPSWPWPEQSHLRTPPAAPAGAPAVIYAGDSIAVETRTSVEYFLHSTNAAQLVPATHGGTAICDYLTDSGPSNVPSSQKVATLVKSARPRVVALQFWGNSWVHTPCTGGAATGTDDYFRRYEAHAHRLAQQVTDAAREAGIPRPKLVWVLQGPDAAKPERVRRLNAMFEAVATSHGDAVSDAGWSVSLAAYGYEKVADGRYKPTGFLPCIAAERAAGYCTKPADFGGVTQLHKDGDPVHFCLGTMSGTPRSCDTKSPGLVRYASAIAHTISQHTRR